MPCALSIVGAPCHGVVRGGVNHVIWHHVNVTVSWLIAPAQNDAGSTVVRDEKDSDASQVFGTLQFN